MYALLSSPISHLPTIVSTNSFDYPEMMQMGYTQIMTGYKKELEKIAEELTVDFVNELELNSDIN